MINNGSLLMILCKVWIRSAHHNKLVNLKIIRKYIFAFHKEKITYIRNVFSMKYFTRFVVFKFQWNVMWNWLLIVIFYDYIIMKFFYFFFFYQNVSKLWFSINLNITLNNSPLSENIEIQKWSKQSGIIWSTFLEM